MRAVERIGLVVGVFAAVVCAIYWGWTGSTELGVEWVGVMTLLLASLLGFMLAWYTWMTRRRLETDPSDDPLGEVDEIQGEYGFFSPHSWQPLFLAGAASVCFLGLAVGWWLFIIGAVLGVPALIGWTFEYWKGQHAL
ncbi:cytochrome c oxidase subunit 4 [Phycicoccus endophyticus]|uniref:Cytochrome c oxidase polypeptide 4 n=1 Tax=Phycicoccus endophyticus TaxID=1690220 RepID=A0A7G9R500_9MICO|nr:cytochrome c oxidase subunit 4 [Phycicoccus endophyticus]NHI20938.1 cytochrome c oxidase subunit 4 [Phycicoccus endophyticus]QNN50675.1 cytochrome c oxidase subunit 4 [Phycicoccus endophyticus]GGL22484.1 cytochrome c oxidase polypeptide 4 [Phycicoccus endophyticus]